MAGEAERRLRDRLARLKNVPLLGGTRLDAEAKRLEKQLADLESQPSDDEIWRSVELARHSERPYTLDYVSRMLDDWVELHGDRGRADDGAMVAGLGSLEGRTIVLVGMQKGRDIQERTKRQFGMPYPEGYRKAMRAMELADRHGFPVISLVDTPGAYPGVAAEQHGQGGPAGFRDKSFCYDNSFLVADRMQAAHRVCERGRGQELGWARVVAHRLQQPADFRSLIEDRAIDIAIRVQHFATQLDRARFIVRAQQNQRERGAQT